MIITQTPLRISFAGGGTDFPDFYRQHEGAVLSTAIDKYVFVIIKERFDDMIYLNWMKKEIVNDVSKIEHELIREAMKLTGVTRGVEITTLADIPAEGSGLGSSSSLTVCLLHALYLHTGKLLDAETLARQACEIEIDILDKPNGKQDQYIATYGGLRYFEFKKNDSVLIKNPKITSEVLHETSLSLLLFFTGKTRKAAGVLSEQKNNIELNTKILKEMKNLSHEIMTSLEKGDIRYLGKALEEGWELKKQLSNGITNPEIDLMYQTAKKAGAIGGKIAGAGGGGFLLLFVPLEKQSRVKSALKNYKELKFNLEKDGSKAIFNIRR